MTSEVGLNTVPSTSSSTPSAQRNPPSSALGQDAFLTLLLTQMENQNPLDPSDPTEFLSQLAAFSSLEQMQQVSEGIESLAGLQATSLSLQNVNLVGKTVVYESTAAPVRDRQASFRYLAPDNPDRIVVEYRSGGERKTAEIHPGHDRDQTLQLEELLGDTVEVLSIKGYRGDQALDSTIKLHAVAAVDGVSFEGGLPKLMLGPGTMIEPAAVIQILN